MSKISDLSVKKCISIPDIFCDLYNGGAFKGKQLLKPEDLQRLPSESYQVLRDKNQKKKGVQRYHDIIYSSAFGGDFVIFPVENQKNVHYGMVIRNMLYDALTYTEQLEQLTSEHRENRDLKDHDFLSGMSKEDKLKPIIPLLFYYGEEPWDAGTDLHSILQIPKEIRNFKKLIPNYHLNIVHVGNVQPQNFKTGLREVFELLQFAKEKEALNQYMEQHSQRFSNLDDETSDMILLFLGGEHFMGKKKEKFKMEEGRYNMCTAFREMIEEGRVLGYEQGIKQGFKKGMDLGELSNIIKLVCKKLEKGKKPDEIASDLEENVEYIKNICNIAQEYAPEYKVEDICMKCKNLNIVPF